MLVQEYPSIDNISESVTNSYESSRKCRKCLGRFPQFRMKDKHCFPCCLISKKNKLLWKFCKYKIRISILNKKFISTMLKRLTVFPDSINSILLQQYGQII